MTVDDELLVEQRALKLLSLRDHSSGELTAKLLAKSFCEQSVKVVIAKLEADNILDDHGYCQRFIEQQAEKGMGPLLIQKKLRDRHVAEMLIDSLMIDDDEFWFEKVAGVIRKKFGGIEVAMAKKARFLVSRGFTSRHIAHVLNTNCIE